VKNARLLGAQPAPKDGRQERQSAEGLSALVATGMMGDRVDVIFAVPEEISKMIEGRC